MLLPVALNLANRRVLIVGGGVVATRKAASVIECGARVTAISPSFSPDFPACEKLLRPFQEGDCENFQLVFAATNSREVNTQIAREAEAKGIWCNVVDDPAASDFHSASTIRRGEITIGVTTGRTSPVLARYVRESIESVVGPELEKLMDWVRSYDIPTEIRGDVWREILQSEILSFMSNGELEAAKITLEATLQEKFGLRAS